jgi:hypothetical protein
MRIYSNRSKKKKKIGGRKREKRDFPFRAPEKSKKKIEYLNPAFQQWLVALFPQRLDIHMFVTTDFLF